jgi:hypothetical protein
MRLIAGRVAALLPISIILVGCGDQGNSSHWSGKTYLLSVPEKHWTKPSRDIGGEIAPFVPQFLLAIGGSGSNLTVTVATAKTDGSQDTCNQTQQSTLSDSQYPDSQIVVSEFPMLFQQLDDTVTPNETITLRSTLHDLTFTNVLPGDSPATAGSLAVTADIAELYPLFIKVLPKPTTADSVCSTVASTLGWSPAVCPQCTFNGTSYCLNLGAVQLGATLATATVKSVSAADIPASCP